MSLPPCLHVLLKSIDDFYSPAREKSLGLLVRLRQLLVIDGPQVSPKEVAPKAHRKHKNFTDSDRVIDEILSVDDLCLVKNMLANTDPNLRGTPAAVTKMDEKDFSWQIRTLKLDWMLKSTVVYSDLYLSDLDSLIEDIEFYLHQKIKCLKINCDCAD